MSRPQNGSIWSKKMVVGAVLTLVVFLLLVKLGLWQLSRGEEKLQLEQNLAARAQLAPVSLGAALERSSISDLTGLRVQVSVLPNSDTTFLLDNQTYEGTVGYLAYQLVQEAQGHWMLVERGFIPAGRDRRVLPNVEWLIEPQTMVGRLYAKSHNPLSSDLNLEQNVPHRIQNLNMDALSQWWGEPILPVVFQPQQVNWPYPQPWVPVPLSADKHFAYAVQWFSMAFVLCVIALVILLRNVKSRRRV